MLKDTLDKFGKTVIQQSRTRLTKDKSNYTKELYNSLKYETKKTNKGFEMSFEMSFHGAVLDEGISGTKKKRSSRFSYKQSSNIPIKPLSDWAKAKGIKPRNKKTGRFTTFKSIGFALAHSIKQKGREGTQFFTKSFNQQFDKLPDEVAEAVGLDLDILLNKSINGNR
jgi:hypothetical protein